MPCDCVAFEAVDAEALVAALGAFGGVPEVVDDGVGACCYGTGGTALVCTAGETGGGGSEGEGK